MMSACFNSAVVAISFAMLMAGVGCVDAGTAQDIADPDSISSSDTLIPDTRFDSTVPRDTVNDITPDVDAADNFDTTGYQPCESGVLECGLNQTCLVGPDLEPFCECLSPYVWWDNVDLPDEPEEGRRYPLEENAICLQQMPDEYFDDFPEVWWDEYGELYGYPDELEYVEPVWMLYDKETRTLSFAQPNYQFVVREDGVGILWTTLDDDTWGSVEMLKISKTRVVYYTFDWPSGELTNIWPLILR